MLAFLGVAADRRLLDEDRFNLPEADQRRHPASSSHTHKRLVAAGSLLTGVTLIGGVIMMLYGGWQALFNRGDANEAILAAAGILLAGTHWVWVHVAEYLGLTIDEHHQRATDERDREWLAEVEPYPRFSVSTSVLDDASTRVIRVLHQPVLTAQHTFTFIRATDAEQTYGAHTPAETIATAVEKMRRKARLDTDRLHQRWETAAIAYAATLSSLADDHRRLAAEHAAATALSEHINAALHEPPLLE